VKLIGYDFDGVFVNIEDQKAALFGDVLHRHWQVDRKAAIKVWMHNLGTSRRHKFDLLYRRRYRRTLTDAVYDEIEYEFSSLLMTDYYPSATLVRETADAARDLNDCFDLSFISSGIPHQELNYLTGRYRLDRYFTRVLGTNGTFQSKVDHFEMVTEAAEPDLGIFIADGLEDMHIAKRFGFVAIALPTNHPPKALRAAGADVICELSELKGEIQRRLDAAS
jgi:phosphoglycolate phosphatase-like HAD superfamily hydrolase